MAELWEPLVEEEGGKKQRREGIEEESRGPFE